VYLDVQVYQVAGLLGAALGSTLCKAVFRHPMPRPPADNLMPCIAVWRESETWKGTEPGFREFTAKFSCKVYLGRHAYGTPLEDAWGSLHDYAKRIDQALVLGRHASWGGGEDLSVLAGVEAIEAGEAVNSGELPEQPNTNTAYPATTIEIEVVHHEVQADVNETAYDHSLHHYDVNPHPSAAKTATLNAVGPVTATWTPVLSGVTVVTVPGGALGVVVVDRTATVTVVVGTTTYAAIKLAWDAEADALALATLAGTAGTVAAGYAGETLHLWYDDARFGFDALQTRTDY
jgi:hypothetical protein